MMKIKLIRQLCIGLKKTLIDKKRGYTKNFVNRNNESCFYFFYEENNYFDSYSNV
jgi:hypothetical protein